MNLSHTILGFLSWRPSTGYDLKKMFVNSPFVYWSGNNNQIYKTLIDLHKEGLVKSVVEHSEKSPLRKVYTITDQGAAELRRAILLPPGPPRYRNEFLLQLAWADQLEPSALDNLLEDYEQEIYAQSLMSKELKKRHLIDPSRTGREAYLWDMIAENRISAFESELEWVRKLRLGLKGGLPDDYNRDG